MLSLNSIKTKLFWILAITQSLFGLTIFYIQIRAILSATPWENYPFEHVLSSVGVLFFCFGAAASCYLMWLVDVKKKWLVPLPVPAIVLVTGALITILSAVFYHYLTMIGWCCEHPLAFYFGFPFSYLVGIGSHLFSVMLPYKDYGLLQILYTSQLQLRWQFFPFLFFLDFIFWSNTMVVFLSIIARMQKRTLFEPTKEEIQSKTT